MIPSDRASGINRLLMFSSRSRLHICRDRNRRRSVRCVRFASQLLVHCLGLIILFSLQSLSVLSSPPSLLLLLPTLLLPTLLMLLCSSELLAYFLVLIISLGSTRFPHPWYSSCQNVLHGSSNWYWLSSISFCSHPFPFSLLTSSRHSVNW